MTDTRTVLITHPRDGHTQRDTCLDCLKLESHDSGSAS